jgi:pyruvate-formate lyase-activating enzyme
VNTTNEDRIKVLELKRNTINTISPSFCSAKWLQTSLYLQNGFNHSCHHPSAHKIPVEEVLKNPAALHNSKYKKEQRAKMLNGVRPKECDYCWKIEDLDKNYFSDRHYKTADWWSWDKVQDIAKSSPADDIFPTYLEVSFSNACNFACAYCSPDISSTWMKDIEEHGNYPVENGNHDLNYLKSVGKIPYKRKETNPYMDAWFKWMPEVLPHLRVFRVTGGEPTMSKDVWRTFDYIIENPQPQMQLAINTNLGVDKKLIDKLIKYINLLEDKVEKIDVYTSVESTGAQAEYARDGIQYDYWYNNCKRILGETNSLIAIMTTLNILSLPTFNDFIKDIMDLRILFNKGLENNRIPISLNYLRWPPHLQASLLDTEERQKYVDSILPYGEQWLKYYSKDKYARLYLEEWDQLKRWCDYLISEPTQVKFRKDFVNYIKAYDIRRDKNFKETFTEYAHLLEEWDV